MTAAFVLTDDVIQPDAFFHKYEAYNALDAVGKLHGNVDGKHRKHGKIA